MAAIADFLSDILGGITLVGFSLVVGGIAWSLAILRALTAGSIGRGAPNSRAIRLIRFGAIMLAFGQAVEIAAKAYILSVSMERSPFPGIYGLGWYDAAALRTILALALATAAGWLARAPEARERWSAVGALAVAIAIAGGWLTHAFSRIEDRGLLMGLTALHMLAGAVWVGGVLHLMALRRLVWRDASIKPLWPIAVRRFAGLGVVAVGLAVLTATPLTLYYVKSLGGLIGTGYGSMVIIKILLLATALAFARLNFSAGRSGDTTALTARVPHYIEAETFVLITLLLAASGLAHQPPAIDITSQQATFQEVAGTFAPKLPTVISPTHAEMPTDPNNPLGISATDTALENEWSNYNHNVSGLTLISIALLALLSRLPGFAWARHWPLGFVLLAAFLFVRSDPETWPLGQVPFWESLASAEVFQHRLAVLLAAALGLMEWRARVIERSRGWSAYVFPVLAAFGGVLLLTHSHSAFELKPQYLIQVSHTAMGLFAMFLGIGRWLELRLEPPAGRWAGLGAVLSLLAIGVILTFYREAMTV
jgi:putative copper resistance protein D